jgi:hypothetical protein
MWKRPGMVYDTWIASSMLIDPDKIVGLMLLLKLDWLVLFKCLESCSKRLPKGFDDELLDFVPLLSGASWSWITILHFVTCIRMFALLGKKSVPSYRA